MVGINRPRGILSKADRKLLTGQSEIKPKSQQERNARSRIRERIEAGLRDFELLADADYLEERDLDPVRTSDISPADSEPVLAGSNTDDPALAQPNDPEIAPHITEALIEMVAFAFRVKPEPAFIECVIERGLRRGLDRYDPNAELSDVQISIENPETVADRVGAYIDKGWQLSRWEVTFALENDIRPAEELGTHVQEHGFRGDDWTPGNSRHQMPFPAPCPECGGNIDEEGICIECGASTH